MNEAAERFNRIYDENTKQTKEDSPDSDKPSELKKKQRELESKIEKIEKRKEKLKSRRFNQGEKYARGQISCPECGSTKDPKVSGWLHVVTGTCKDCGFEGSYLD
jgi:predicted  nucleic acid-binding Zn ribbon protein